MWPKCKTDLGSLTEEDKATVEAWLHSRDRFLTVIPLAAVLARRRQLVQRRAWASHLSGGLHRELHRRLAHPCTC